ncbi:NAD/NADP octopine/nopaline dehydrogenase family protein [Terrisporobacter mayombei]|nr:NAD/NADP octopine/nopaline dehydrogenase family protein [Terrisporobacter mayombei]
MKVERVAILGGGNGGITAAADLSNKGFEVSLFQSDKFCRNLDVIKEKGEILLQTLESESTEKVHLVTDDIKEAILGAQIIMLAIPGMAVEYFAEILAPVVREDQIIYINSAAAMGCIRFVNKAKEMGIEKKFKICESNSLTYGTRAFADEARVELSLRVKKLFLGSYPASDIDEIMESLSQLYDCFVPAKNIWHVNLENGNPEVHPGPALLNAGRIDYSNGEFWLYKEGITEHTINVLQAVEKERVALGRALGFEVEGARESRINRGYLEEDKNKTLQELFNTSEVFGQIKGPTSVTNRYITEDISTGLVLWSSLGKILKVPTPNIDAIIVLGGTLLQTDFYKIGLTVEKLGIKGVHDKQGLIDAV